MEWLEWCFFFFLLFAFCFLMKWSLDCHYEIINDVNGTRPYFLSTFFSSFLSFLLPCSSDPFPELKWQLDRPSSPQTCVITSEMR
ncbi:hypothetical protein V8C43DRAFT_64150 [Trichoderma afarasin]